MLERSLTIVLSPRFGVDSAYYLGFSVWLWAEGPHCWVDASAHLKAWHQLGLAFLFTYVYVVGCNSITLVHTYSAIVDCDDFYKVAADHIRPSGLLRAILRNPAGCIEEARSRHANEESSLHFQTPAA